MTQTHRLLLKWARLLHVYLTLFGFVLLLFFAVTGFMLNHEDWFSPAEPARKKIDAKIALDLLGKLEDRDAIAEVLQKEFAVDGDANFDIDKDGHIQVIFQANDQGTTAVIHRESGAVTITCEPENPKLVKKNGSVPVELLGKREDRLGIVEALRRDFGVRGELDSFDYTGNGKSFRIVFKSPGYFAEVSIQREDGAATADHEMHGVVGLALDLHRAKTSGLAWSFVVDGVSILFVVVSMTGLILWSSLRGRAQHGLAVLALGVAIGLAVYFLGVPR